MLKRLFVDFLLGTVCLIVIKWLYRLALGLGSNAVMGWGDDQIAKMLGITSPELVTVVSIVTEWGPPIALTVLLIWGYHWWRDDKARQPALAGGNGGELDYLSHKDSDLGQSIQAAARHSAWGRWYAAQILASGQPAEEGELLRAACTVVFRKIIDGDVEVRGRKPNKLEFESIPRTDWRSSALYFQRDDKTLTWRLLILPTGGAQISRDGNIEAFDGEAEQRTARLRVYDSLIVDAHKFESLWPKSDAELDKFTKKLLSKAKRPAAPNQTETKQSASKDAEKKRGCLLLALTYSFIRKIALMKS